MELDAVSRAWPELGRPRVHPLRQGANNAVSLVETPSGERYILRVSTQADAGRLQHEINIVTALQQAGLPFSVPATIPTRTGNMSLRLPSPEKRTATLWPLVPGTHSTGNNVRQAYAAGRALALLQAALKRIDPVHSSYSAGLPVAGDLSRYHPLVPNPAAAIAALPIVEQQKLRLLTLVDHMTISSPPLYATLPRQLIHNDYDPSNLLFTGRRVAGVLDWEWSTVDLRAMDLAIALCWWPRPPLWHARRWTIMADFVQGYARYTSLTPEEGDALPFLIQLRTVATLINRVGWYLEGRDPEQLIVRRVHWTLEIDNWLSSAAASLREIARV